MEQPHDKIFRAQQLLLGVVNDLNIIAKAFLTTGNEQMHGTLRACAVDIDEAGALFREASGAMLERESEQSKQNLANVLTLGLEVIKARSGV